MVGVVVVREGQQCRRLFLILERLRKMERRGNRHDLNTSECREHEQHRAQIGTDVTARARLTTWDHTRRVISTQARRAIIYKEFKSAEYPH